MHWIWQHEEWCMIERSDDKRAVETISIITVRPRYQQHIIDNIRGLLESLARPKDGFISARISRSLDGTRIAYIVLWRSQEDASAWLDVISDAVMLTKSEVQSSDYNIYEPVETIQP
jgi:heme-degrading monooxygenase HmoA